MTKPLAKSLHTVTVLVRVAKALNRDNVWSNGMALDLALDALGLADLPDSYGLAAQALKQLNKGQS